MTPTAGVAAAVERGDLDDLLRVVDRLCAARDWAGLLELRDRCRAALERGRQLWPAAAHAEYRLALEAPGAWAAVVLEAGTGRFTLGPLAEVAASTHTWSELADHVPAGPVASLTAHERVVRGEDLRGDDRVDPSVLDIPAALAPWEPAYPLAEYGPAEAHFPTPPAPALGRAAAVPPVPERLEADDGVRALLELAGAWTTESNGRAQAAVVAGPALAAVAALGVARVRAAQVNPDDAVAHMAWTAASGGAHGRRRGMATGRFGAWWAAAAVGDLLDVWPITSATMGEAIAGLRWYLWDAGEPATGWSLHLAVENPGRGISWALAAVDAA